MNTFVSCVRIAHCEAPVIILMLHWRGEWEFGRGAMSRGFAAVLVVSQCCATAMLRVGKDAITALPACQHYAPSLVPMPGKTCRVSWGRFPP
jgi:hypothetical protein